MAVAAQVIGAVRVRLAGLDYHWQALWVIVLGSFMVILNTTALNVALPRIIQIFQTTVDQGQLILTAYMLALGVVMPATSYVADTFGAKRAYLTSIVLFTLGSALCGLAPNIEGLIAFRILQGLGGGMTMPLGMSILFQVAPARLRGTVMGVYGLPTLAAPMVGPIIGGYIVDNVGWRVIFLVGIPVGVAAVLLGAAVLREMPKRAAAHFDWLGFSLAAIGLGSLLLALSRAPRDGWLAPHIVAFFLTAAIAMVCWVFAELTQEHPLLDLSVLRNGTYRLSVIISLLIMIVFMSSMLLLTLFLQGVRGLSAFEAGLLLAPQGLAAALTMPVAGRLLDAVGPRVVIIPGVVVLAISTWLLSTVTPSTPDVTLHLLLVLRGVAMGSVFMPLNATAMDSIPRPQISRATTLSNVFRQLAGAFGTAVFTSIYLTRQNFHHAFITQVVTSTSINVAQFMSSTKAALLRRGFSEPVAQLESLTKLSRMVDQQASVRAFNDCFYLSTVIVVVALVPLCFLKRARKA